VGIDYHQLLVDFQDPQSVKKLLMMYVAQYEDLNKQIQALNNHTSKQRNLIHKLKGVSGNIHLTALYSLVKKANETQDDTVFHTLLPKIIVKNNETCKVLKTYYDIKSKTKKQNELSSDDQIQYILQLQKEISDSDYLSTTTTQTMLENVYTILDTQSYLAFEQALNTFEYQEAKSILEQFHA
jgi:two-component system, sensor histidine kinase and response regulator